MGMIDSLLGDSPRRHYRRRGYYVFRDVFPVEQIDALADTARNMMPDYQGEHLRQDGRPAVNDFYPGTRLIRNPPFNLHLPLASDLRPLSVALQALITAPALADRLRELDGAEHYHINQTLLFFAAQTTEFHIDSWALDTVPHGGAHTLWIPLRDMDFKSGLPSILPWPMGKLVSEQELGLSSDRSHADRYAAISRGPIGQTAEGRPGDYDRAGAPRRSHGLVVPDATFHAAVATLPDGTVVAASAAATRACEVGQLHRAAHRLSEYPRPAGVGSILVFHLRRHPSEILGLARCCLGLPDPVGQRGVPRLAIEVCLCDPQALRRQFVIAGLLRCQLRILARQQQAGVDRRLDRLERAAAGRQKQRAWQETERNRA